MKLRARLILLTMMLLSFFSGYALGNFRQELQVTDQVQQSPSSEASSYLPSAESLTKSGNVPAGTKDIIIVFTVDETKRIKVLNVSGGYNLLTSYIRQSLEWRLLESGNAVPGINYVMTLKFPSSV